MLLNNDFSGKGTYRKVHILYLGVSIVHWVFAIRKEPGLGYNISELYHKIFKLIQYVVDTNDLW
jgi:hypothetical protein